MSTTKQDQARDAAYEAIERHWPDAMSECRGNTEPECESGEDCADDVARSVAAAVLTVTVDQIEHAAEAAFMSDDIGGHHKAYPGYFTPLTWQNIPEAGRENYRRLVRDIVIALGMTADVTP